jgi:hypothetical protein
MGIPRIEAYRFGHLVIDGQAHTKDLIILPDRVIAGWWRNVGHALHTGDLKAVLEARPDVLVVGQGAQGLMQVTSEVEQALKAAGMQLIAQPTEQACQTYNQLRTQRQVAAALHLTC